MDTPDAVLVRATVSLQGLPVGSTAFVDPLDPYIRGLLKARFLEPLVPLVPDLTDDGGGEDAAAAGEE